MSRIFIREGATIGGYLHIRVVLCVVSFLQGQAMRRPQDVGTDSKYGTTLFLYPYVCDQAADKDERKPTRSEGCRQYLIFLSFYCQ